MCERMLLYINRLDADSFFTSILLLGHDTTVAPIDSQTAQGRFHTIRMSSYVWLKNLLQQDAHYSQET